MQKIWDEQHTKNVNKDRLSFFCLFYDLELLCNGHSVSNQPVVQGPLGHRVPRWVCLWGFTMVWEQIGQPRTSYVTMFLIVEPLLAFPFGSTRGRIFQKVYTGHRFFLWPQAPLWLGIALHENSCFTDPLGRWLYNFGSGTCLKMTFFVGLFLRSLEAAPGNSWLHFLWCGRSVSHRLASSFWFFRVLLHAGYYLLLSSILHGVL